MRLEYRTQELIEETSEYKIYKLKCSLKEALDLKQYIIEQEPLSYFNRGWHFNCMTEKPDEGTYINGRYFNFFDHMTFIIPKYWQNKGIKEGYYKADKYEEENPHRSGEKLYHEIVNYFTNEGKLEKTYRIVSFFSNDIGNDEFFYLNTLCDIEKSLEPISSIATYNLNDVQHMAEEMLPLTVRTNITIKVPNDMVL